MRSPLLVPLETARLRLEPIRAAHADRLFAGFSDPALYTYETDGPPRSPASLRARYARLESGRSPEGDQHWLNWVPVVRASGAAIGFVQASLEDDLHDGSIGYTIVGAHQRQGYGAEAVGAMVDHLIAHGVASLRAIIDVRNAASIALVERLHFERLGTRRSDDVIGGVRGFDHDYVRRRPRAAEAAATKSPA